MKYGYRPHRGSLQDSLKESVYLTKEQFYKWLCGDGSFDFYGYDNRCNQVLFLNSVSDWLFIELSDKELYRVGVIR